MQQRAPLTPCDAPVKQRRVSLARQPASPVPEGSRPGFTLMEVIIALAVVAVVAAMAVPAYLSWMQSQQLGESIDLLRTHLVQTRTRAMEEGRTYRFAWEPTGNLFRIAPDELEDWPDLSGTPAGPLFSDAAGVAGFVMEGSLKGDVSFVPVGPVTAGPGAMPEGTVATSAEGRIFILFRPNGTANILLEDGSERAQADIGIASGQGVTRIVRVRAITGGTTVFNPGVP